jgi:hypothetical protein
MLVVAHITLAHVNELIDNIYVRLSPQAAGSKSVFRALNDT